MIRRLLAAWHRWQTVRRIRRNKARYLASKARLLAKDLSR